MIEGSKALRKAVPDVRRPRPRRDAQRCLRSTAAGMLEAERRSAASSAVRNLAEVALRSSATRSSDRPVPDRGGRHRPHRVTITAGDRRRELHDEGGILQPRRLRSSPGGSLRAAAPVQTRTGADVPALV